MPPPRRQRVDQARLRHQVVVVQGVRQLLAAAAAAAVRRDVQPVQPGVHPRERGPAPPFGGEALALLRLERVEGDEGEAVARRDVPLVAVRRAVPRDVRRADALPPVALLHPAADRGRRAAVCGRGGVASSAAAARRAAAAVGAVRARALRRAQLLFDLRLRRRHRVAVRGEVDEHAAAKERAEPQRVGRSVDEPDVVGPRVVRVPVHVNHRERRRHRALLPVEVLGRLLRIKLEQVVVVRLERLGRDQREHLADRALRGARPAVRVLRVELQRRRPGVAHVVQVEEGLHRVGDPQAEAGREGAHRAVDAARGGGALPVAVDVEFDGEEAVAAAAQKIRRPRVARHALRRRHVHVVDHHRRVAQRLAGGRRGVEAKGRHVDRRRRAREVRAKPAGVAPARRVPQLAAAGERADALERPLRRVAVLHARVLALAAAVVGHAHRRVRVGLRVAVLPLEGRLALPHEARAHRPQPRVGPRHELRPVRRRRRAAPRAPPQVLPELCDDLRTGVRQVLAAEGARHRRLRVAKGGVGAGRLRIF